MKEKLFLTLILMLLFVGCHSRSDKVSTKEFFLPYYENCLADLDLLEKYAVQADLSAKVSLLRPNILGTPSQPVNSLVRVTYDEAREEVLTSIFNRFSYDCSPNTKVSLNIPKVTEAGIRGRIAAIVGSPQYSGVLLVSLEDGMMYVHYNENGL